MRVATEEPYNITVPNHCATGVQKSLLSVGIDARDLIAVGSPSGVVQKSERYQYFPSVVYNKIKSSVEGYEIKKDQ